MPGIIRYTAQASNRLRSTSTAEVQYDLPVSLSASDLSFDTKAIMRRSYGNNLETIVLSETDLQSVVMSYIESSATEDDGSIQQVREWYKSVSGGQLFEIDMDGTGFFESCRLNAVGYSEKRTGTIEEFSVSFKVRWE